MKINKTFFAFIVAICAMTLFGVALVVNNLHGTNEFRDSLTVSSDGTEFEKAFEGFDLVPGKSVEYVIDMTMQQSGDYKLSLVFGNLEGTGLDQYLDATITFGDKELKKVKLENLLASEKIEHNFTADEKELKSLKIVYSMDIDVGKECAGKTASFDMILTVERK